MNVLSLFDGLSGGQVALNRAGIKYDNYYASEIDEYAIKICKKNYPNTIHVGNVLDVKSENLPKIDLLIGGSPCQGFSFAGKRLNFDDPRSKLFFEFVRLYNELKPKYFFLENVKMKSEHKDVISDYLGVHPVLVNSSKFSAQFRERLYWTNIPALRLPDDVNIVVKDILEPTIDQKFYYKYVDIFPKCPPVSDCPLNGERKLIQIGDLDINGHDILKRVYSVNGLCPTLNTMGGGNRQPKFLDALTGEARKSTPLECERLQTLPDNYTEGVSNSQRYKMIGNGWTVDTIAWFFKHIV